MIGIANNTAGNFILFQQGYPSLVTKLQKAWSCVVKFVFSFSQRDTSESGDVKATGEESKETEKDEPEPPKEPAKPRALHQTLSLFVRNVPPKISHNDIALVSVTIIQTELNSFLLKLVFLSKETIAGVF